MKAEASSPVALASLQALGVISAGLFASSLALAGLGLGRDEGVGIAVAVLVTSLSYLLASVHDRSCRRRLKEDFSEAPSWRSAVLVTLGFLGLSLFLGKAIAFLGLDHFGALGRLSRLILDSGGGRLLMFTIVIGLLPGLCEECFFRQRLFRLFEGRRFAAVFVTSVWFGISHLDRVQGPAAFLLGLYLGWVRTQKGGLRLAILAHLTNNVLAVWFVK